MAGYSAGVDGFGVGVSGLDEALVEDAGDAGLDLELVVREAVGQRSVEQAALGAGEDFGVRLVVVGRVA